jgi:sulfate permease, SulP family
MARTRYQASQNAIPLSDLPAAALRAVLREGYTARDLRADLLAGLVVGVLALPLAMALGVAVGASPQHGLYTAIVAGLVVAALGGSRMQVTGPTAAFVVVIAPIHANFGSAGLLVAGLLAGVLLIAMGAARLGRFIQFIPHPVTSGFTAGIATVIATLQMKDLLGLQLSTQPAHFMDRVAAMVAARHTLAPGELAIGLLTLAILVWFPRATRRVPAAIVALPIASVAAIALGAISPDSAVATIATRFETSIDGAIIHGIPPLPPLPIWPWLAPGPGGAPLSFSLATFRELVPAAFAIAMLGAIESLLSAVIADGMAQTKHDPDAELLALGIGNVIVPFFGGIPATGALARTATNIRSGARSPIAAMIHSLALLLSILALAPLLGYLPMTSLAALLLLVAWNMSDVKHVLHTLQVAPRSDVAVLLTCYTLTVVFDMVVGVAVGMVLAAFMFMGRMAEATEARLMVTGSRSELPAAGGNPLLGPIPPGIAVYEISGPLFFGAAEKAMATLSVLSDRSKGVIFVMDDVPVIDVTGLVAFESALDWLRKQARLAILSGVRPQPMAVLKRARIDQREGVVLCATWAQALIAAGNAPSIPPPSPAPG